MPAIVFDCLVLPEETDGLAPRSAPDSPAWRRRGVTSHSVNVSDAPTDDQLLEQWERENPGEPVGERTMRRYSLELDGVAGSLNSLTMDLSRLLTPAAELPDDPVLRQFDDMLESIAIYRGASPSARNRAKRVKPE